MRLRVLLLGVLCASVANLHCDIVDRIVATVARQAITLSDVRLQYRLECFISATEAGVPDAAKSEEMLERLVDQALIRREMGENTFPPAAPEEVAPRLKQIRDRYPDDAAWRAALDRYGLTQGDLERLVQFQADVLSFINLRVLPGLQLTQADVEKFYREEFLPELRKRGAAEPPLEDVRDRIMELVQKRAENQRLAELLKEMRARTEVHRR
jgi:hypothetical protein